MPFDMEQLYLYSLIVAGALTILYVFFGDVAEGVGEGIPILNPAVILAFVTFLSAAGYIGEVLFSFSSLYIFIASAGVAIILDVLLYFFVLIPLRSSESSIVYTDESLVGKIATVITPIPKDGFGEVLIDSVSGKIAKRAVSYEGDELAYNTEVLVIEVKGGTLFVKEYEVFRFQD